MVLIFSAWTLLAIFSIIGVAGVVIPGLPGTALLFVGAFIHKIMLPAVLSWWTVLILAGGAILAWGIDFAGSFYGAKWSGASKWGLLGAALGAFVGIFFLPIGLIAGPLVGAFIGELVAARKVKDAAKSGVGAGIGVVFSVLIRIGLTLGLLGWMIVDAFFIHG